MSQCINGRIDTGLFGQIFTFLFIVTFGTEIFVIRYKQFHSIVWKECTEFSSQLYGQCFVVTQYQGWTFLQLCNDLCHGKGFACPCTSPQHTMLCLIVLQCLQYLCNRFWLVTSRFVRCLDAKQGWCRR